MRSASRLKLLVAVMCACAGLAPLRAQEQPATVGETKEAVLQRLGRPEAIIQAGAKTIVQYPGGVIEFRDDKVSYVDPQFGQNLAVAKEKQAAGSRPKGRGAREKNRGEKPRAAPPDEGDGQRVAPAEKPPVEKPPVEKPPVAAPPPEHPPAAEPAGNAPAVAAPPDTPPPSLTGKIAGFFAGMGAKAGALFAGNSAAKTAYEKFALYVAMGELEKAKPFATGNVMEILNPPAAPAPAATRGRVGGLIAQMNSPQSLERYKNQLINEVSGPIQGVSYTYQSVKSEKSGDAARVKIEAVQMQLRVRNGATAFTAGVRIYYKHTVEVVKVGDAWKVSSFSKEGPLEKK